MDIEKLKLKYLGRKVYAGSEMNGYDGTITDIVEDEDMPDQIWFVVTEEKTVGMTPRVEKWDKCELQKIIVTTKLVPLD